MKKFDVVVLGSGVAGYSVAIGLAKQGLNVAVFEEDNVGGECVNYGCVPSKAFYVVSESIKNLRKINGEAYVDWRNLVDWVKNIVNETRVNIERLLETNGASIIRGRGVVKRIGVVSNGSFDYEYERLIVATGTNPKELKNIRLNGRSIVSNREIFYLEDKPSRLLVIGGGVIGVEAANIFANLGVDTVVVEALEHVLPFVDQDVASSLRRYMAERGVKVYEKTIVERIVENGSSVKATLSNGVELDFDRVLLSIGRTPRSTGFGLENVNVELDKEGYIRVNEGFETNVKNVYAIGDVRGPPLLAHKAIVDAAVLVKLIRGEETFRIPDQLIPQTVFSGLEVSWIGYSEKDLNGMSINYRRFKLPVYYLSAVRVKDSKFSFVKIIVDEKDYSKIYGVWIIAPNASEVVSSFLPFVLGRTDWVKLSKTPYPHLTVSEVVREVAEFILGESIHYVVKK